MITVKLQFCALKTGEKEKKKILTGRIKINIKWL